MKPRGAALPLLALALTLPAAGCEHRFFRTRGALASEAGSLGTWRAAPEGCSLDPADGLPPGRSSTVATFVWPDPLTRDPLREKDRATAPNQPLQLEIVRAEDGIAANLTTIRSERPTRLDATVCTALTLSTQLGKPQFPGAKPTLSGNLRFACEVQGSHLTADIHFSGCAF